MDAVSHRGSSKGLRAERCGGMASSGCRNKSFSPEIRKSVVVPICFRGTCFLRDNRMHQRTSDLGTELQEVWIVKANPTVPRF